MNIFSKLFAVCGGASPRLLKKCPSETPKYATIGITILFTGIFAAFSGGYAFYKIFNKEIIGSNGQVIGDTFFEGAIIMGVLWGIMIFNLDRFIVLSMKKQDDLKKEILIAIPRIILAVIISLVVAKPLEVRLFQDRIAAQISDNELAKRQQNKDKVLGITGVLKVDSLNATQKEVVEELEAKKSQDCQTLKCREAYNAYLKANNTYNRVNAAKSREKAQAQKDINFIENTDKYKITVIKDSIPTKELSKEGKAKLRRAEDKKRAAQKAINDAYSQRNSADKVYKQEVENYRKEIERKIAEADKDLEEIRREKEKADSLTDVLITKADGAAELAYTNNFITQLEALGDLTKWKYDKVDKETGEVIEEANNTMYYINIAVIMLFIVIETAPVFVKVISSKGQYDVALDAETTQVEAKLIHEANTFTSIEEQKNQLKLQALINNQQAQLNVLQTAVQNWQAQKHQELQSGNLTDEDYRKIISEILEFDIIQSRKTTKHVNGKTGLDRNVLFRPLKKLLQRIYHKHRKKNPVQHKTQSQTNTTP